MNVLDLVRDNIKKIEPYSSARDEYTIKNSEMVFLDANESPFESNVNRYPDPKQQVLKAVIAAKYSNISTNKILLGNGSDEVLDLIFRAFCEPNIDCCITVKPSYGMYAVLANINAVKNISVSLKKDFSLDVLSLKNNFTKNSKLLFLCSPNNPTGKVIDKNTIKTLLQEFQGLVIIDEAYIDFCIEKSALSLLDEFPNLILIKTLSKAYGLAGIRLGICFASTEIITILNKIKPPYNVNALSQEKAIECLKNTKKIEKQIAIIKSERNRMIGVFKQIFFIEKTYESDANFILIKVDDATKRYQELLKAGFVVRNRTNQELLTNCLRISIGTPEENKKLIKALKSI